MNRSALMAALGVFTLTTCTAVLAQFGGYDLTWNSIDGGGQMFSTGGTYSLGGTIGQPDAQAGPVMGGGAYELAGGFWTAPIACACRGDMNGDGLKDGRDVQQFVGCIINPGNCTCADTDLMSGVNLDDVDVFVEMLLTGATCP